MTPLLRGPSGCGIEDSPVSVAQLRDSIDSSFTVVLSTGEMVRCSVPLLHRHPSGLCYLCVCVFMWVWVWFVKIPLAC